MGFLTLALFSLCCACNLAIGLERQKLPDKETKHCTTNEECDDLHDCTQDICQLETETCTHYLFPATRECRGMPVENVCDIAPEYCDGESYDCPDDALQPDTVECRASVGQCDEPEYCDGESPLCPDDSFSRNDKVCDDGDDCTYDDTCDGAGSCLGTNGLYDVAQLSIGPWGMFNCALLQSGQVLCWGNNNYGQLGDGSEQHRYVAVAVVGLPADDPVAGLAAGGRHTNVLLASGKIMAWGLGDTGQLGDGNSGDYYEVHTPGYVIGVPEGWREVASGYLFNCAVQEDNTAYCWGRNDQGQLGNGSFDNSAVPVPVTGLGEVSTVISASYHVCAIDATGSLFCWGRGDRGQLGIPASADPSPVPVPVEGLSGTILDVACGTLHSCALLESGEVWCWGTNEYGQLGTEESDDTHVPVMVEGLPLTIMDIDTEYEHTCALLEEGEVMCWGHNDEGQIGDGSIGGIYYQPVSVEGLPMQAVALTAGAHHTCVILENATIRCWGHNAFGELGIGTDVGSPEPVEPFCR